MVESQPGLALVRCWSWLRSRYLKKPEIRAAMLTAAATPTVSQRIAASLSPKLVRQTFSSRTARALGYQSQDGAEMIADRFAEGIVVVPARLRMHEGVMPAFEESSLVRKILAEAVGRGNRYQQAEQRDDDEPDRVGPSREAIRPRRPG